MVGGGLRSTAEDIVWTIVFVVCIMSFLIGFLGVSNPNSEALEGDKYKINETATAMNSWVNDFQTFKNDTSTKLSAANPYNQNILMSVFLIFEAAFTIPKDFLKIMSRGLVNVTEAIQSAGSGGLGGVVSLAAGILGAILLIRLVLYIVETIRTGSAGR